MRLPYIFALVCLLASPALGQPTAAPRVSLPGAGRAGETNQPVLFTADACEDAQNLVICSGHVQAWQNDHMLAADRLTYDRATGVAEAQGHVVLTQPDGQALFSDHATLSNNMRDAVLLGMSTRMAENARMIANGARRTDGALNELSRAVYSTCDACAKDPTGPVLWQLRAATATQDIEHQRIEYTDAFLDIYGVPVFYFPFFWHADPSVKRASGILPPLFGVGGHLGTYLAQPYYWVLDDQSDAILTPEATSKSGEKLGVEYRRAFDDGTLSLNSSVADYQDRLQGHIFANGQFNLNDFWRYGFSINRASSDAYLRNFRIADVANTLATQVYLEGFGQGAYAKLDTRVYQGLTTSEDTRLQPVVLPHVQYDYAGRPDALGGWLHLDSNDFSVQRQIGTSTRRSEISADWQRPLTGRLGDLWQIRLHFDAAGYNATHLNEQPNFSSVTSTNSGQALPQLALEYRWPLLRDSTWGAQVLEPIAQIIVAPNLGSHNLARIPNEDSLDLQFTDANLFSLNHYPGVDRLEGGARANVGLHGAWYPGTQIVDALIGQSYRLHQDDSLPRGSGLNNRASDLVGRVSYVPSSWLDLTARARADNQTLAPRFGDVIAGVGGDVLRFSAGYVYETTNPFYEYPDNPGDIPPPQVPRNEAMLGANTKFGAWKFGGSVRRDLARNALVSSSASAAYENSCLIFAVSYNRRYTSLNGDNGDTTVLFQITFKTVGQLGFHAF